MTFDLANFINIAIGCVLGAIVSWIIAHFYWKLNAPMERVVKELKAVLPHYLQPLRYPQFYTDDAVTVSPEEAAPKDTDIPHVTHAIFSRKDIHAGDQVEVLLHLIDLKRNLENPSGITAKDHLNRALPVHFNGLGLASLEFVAEQLSGETQHKLTIDLADTAGNKNSQTLVFTIKP